MNVTELLEEKRGAIVDEATEAIQRAHMRHYESLDPKRMRERLKTLCDIILECLKADSITPMTRYAGQIAGERFFSGFTLREVQTAFNVLEESIWNQILDEMRPEEFSSAVIAVNGPLRTGKDEVARAYFSLVSRSKVPSPDLETPFTQS
ncbi:MAG: hypothetical protein LAP85_07770 [Acidobacteriia bacterium]|nr:hypothetical protein [Terriglobia bacterium]